MTDHIGIVIHLPVQQPQDKYETVVTHQCGPVPSLSSRSSGFDEVQYEIVTLRAALMRDMHGPQIECVYRGKCSCGQIIIGLTTTS